METVSTKAQALIENLLHVHALANMARASGNKEYLEFARRWLPQIESVLKTMRNEMDDLLR